MANCDELTILKNTDSPETTALQLATAQKIHDLVVQRLAAAFAESKSKKVPPGLLAKKRKRAGGKEFYTELKASSIQSRLKALKKLKVYLHPEKDKFHAFRAKIEGTSASASAKKSGPGTPAGAGAGEGK